MTEIKHCLWYNHNAEEAARFYVTLLRRAGRSA